MKLAVTQGGRAVARSGLLPISADELIGYVSRNSHSLESLLHKCADSDAECDDFAFTMVHAAYSSSEYAGKDLGAKRFLPYQLLTTPLSGPQSRTKAYMFLPIQNDSINAAVLATRWMAGENIRTIENALNVRSGALLSMFSEAASILRGLADILFAITAPQDIELLPASFDGSSKDTVIGLIGSIRRTAARLDVGLPEDVVWMSTLESGAQPVLARAEMMSLRTNGFTAPDAILDTGRFPSLMAALGTPSTQTTRLAQKLQTAVREWRVEERTRLIDSQIKRLPSECKSLVQKYYRSREKDFEKSLEEIFSCLNITISHKDDGTLQSFPDFVIESISTRGVSIECKSKTVGDSVTFNDATDVLRKASVNGLHDSFKVTICQPYISPDVIRNITKCPDLCVVNAEDLAEAFVRIKIGKLTMDDFADWLQRPGQALRDTIPLKNTSQATLSVSDEGRA